MPDYLGYQRSISKELLSVKDRVRHLIDNHHWGEDGRYKEIILSHTISQHLPKGASVGTGFVVNNDKITKQIDIIVYRDEYPLLFKQDDFIIAPAEGVLGIIEVKSRATARVECEAIRTATDNGRIIGRRIFNGIFAFEKVRKTINQDFKQALRNSAGCVDNICLGENIFIKYWDKGSPGSNPYITPVYAVYEISQLSFGYFISNLVEDVYLALHGNQISDTLKQVFYPIEGTKEAYRADKVDLDETWQEDAASFGSNSAYYE